MAATTDNYWRQAWRRMAAPFHQDEIKERAGKGGVNLLYVTERAMIQRLDFAYGAGQWSRQTEVLLYATTTRRYVQPVEIAKDKIVDQEVTTIEKTPSMVRCTVSVYDAWNELWIARDGIADETMVEEEKGAAADAFKRACVPCGALYLYLIPRILEQHRVPSSDYLKRLSEFHGAYFQLLDQIESQLLATTHFIATAVDESDPLG